jgi:hypothetical protein
MGEETTSILYQDVVRLQQTRRHADFRARSLSAYLTTAKDRQTRSRSP